ncbi:MAG: hypothetical protein LC729_00615, partial [Acidobacteria bacterium]|nr:hypothetical protein [Acidobacteriota bacterium]
GKTPEQINATLKEGLKSAELSRTRLLRLIDVLNIGEQRRLLAEGIRTAPKGPFVYVFVGKKLYRQDGEGKRVLQVDGDGVRVEIQRGAVPPSGLSIQWR